MSTKEEQRPDLPYLPFLQQEELGPVDRSYKKGDLG